MNVQLGSIRTSFHFFHLLNIIVNSLNFMYFFLIISIGWPKSFGLLWDHNRDIYSLHIH